MCVLLSRSFPSSMVIRLITPPPLPRVRVPPPHLPCTSASPFSIAPAHEADTAREIYRTMSTQQDGGGAAGGGGAAPEGKDRDGPGPGGAAAEGKDAGEGSGGNPGEQRVTEPTTAYRRLKAHSSVGEAEYAMLKVEEGHHRGLVRSVPMSYMLRGRSAVMLDNAAGQKGVASSSSGVYGLAGAAPPDDPYAHSTSVDTIDYFLSHSWRDSRICKWLIMLYAINHTFAMLSGMSISILFLRSTTVSRFPRVSLRLRLTRRGATTSAPAGPSSRSAMAFRWARLSPSTSYSSLWATSCLVARRRASACSSTRRAFRKTTRN